MTPKHWGLESFWVDKHIKLLEGYFTQRGRGSSVPLLTYLALCISFIWLFLSCSLYDKQVIQSEASS